LVQLAQWQDEFEAIGVNVAAMTYDDRAILADFHAQNDLQYPLLQDEDVKHFMAWGVVNEDSGPGDTMYGIHHPGVLYIDSSGMVELKIAVPGYRTRPPFDEILAAITELQVSE
jgi:peroxiredoxin